MEYKPTTAIILNTSREKKNGKYPVKIRITYKRKQKYYRTGIDLTDDEFKKINSPKPRNSYKEAKIYLNEIENKANKIIRELEDFTFQHFERKFLTKKSEHQSVSAAYEMYIQNLKKDGRIGTAMSYYDSIRSLESYRNDLKFGDITPVFLKSYEKWMIENGRSFTTVGIYLRTLRTIYNVAISEEIIKANQYPFGKRKYQIPANRNIKKALTLPEIEKIFSYKAQEGTPEDKAKDIWIFSYISNGINMKDIARLKYKNIDGENITFVRSKTEQTAKQRLKPVSTVLTPITKEIIDKWGSKPKHPDKYVFSILTNGVTPEKELRLVKQFTQTTNKYLQRIADAVGIDKKVSTYTARHSFATVLKRSGAPMEFISESLGHHDLKTTENYLDSFESEIKKKYASKLTDFKK